MEFLNDMFINPLRVMKNYLLGRGFLTLAVLAASAMGGMTPAIVVGVGGALFSAFMRLGNQALYEEQMVELYRDDIAARLGKDASQVTRADLREAAKDNDIIAQALDRQKFKNRITFFSSALAGAATVGLLALGLPAEIASWFDADTFLGKALSFLSTGLVSGLSSLIVHDGLEVIIGAKTGVSKAAAHDRILDLEHRVQRGMSVTKEQVYGVLVAGNTELQTSIEKEFGKPYARMSALEQAHVLSEIGIADDMKTLARDISNGQVQPGKLAYMISDATQVHRSQQREEAPPVPTQSHVQKLGRAPREQHSFAAQVDADRTMVTERAM